MIMGAYRARHDRRGPGAKADRHARHDHQDRESETQCREFPIADAADEVRIGESLRHHHEDAEKRRHGHLDQVPAYRSIDQLGWFRCHRILGDKCPSGHHGNTPHWSHQL
jgi:hypothetical protein